MNRLNEALPHKSGLRPCTLLRLGLIPTALLACLLVGLVALPHGVVYAASITVTTTDDELNSDGDCSLREAIRAANTNTAVDGCTAGSGADTIVVPAGTYVLTLTGAGEDAAATGDLDVTQSLTIDGAGESTTIIDGNATDRVFQVISGMVGAVTVSISDVTITNGDAGSAAGGGIYNHFGDLTLAYSSVFSNTASAQGGGVFNRGPLTVSHTSISNNTSAAEGGGICSWDANTVTVAESEVSGNSAAEGGGIHSRSPLDITGAIISQNTATGDGGGIWHVWVNLNLTDSVVSDNSAANGGGMYDFGTAVLTGATVRDNTASASGGGIYVDYQSSAELIDSRVGGNSAGTDASCYGGGIYVNTQGTAILNGTSVRGNSASQGGGLASHGTLRLTDSAVDHNTATSGGGGIGNLYGAGALTITSSVVNDNTAPGGAGMYLNGGSATVTDSTISGNIAPGILDSGGGISVFWGTLTMNRCTVRDNYAGNWGGGIDVRIGSANLTNSTISGNLADQGGGIAADYTTRLNNCTVTANTASGGQGGGLYSSDWPEVAAILRNTIVAGNSAPSNPGTHNCGGTINSLGHNLYGDASCTPAHPTDLSNTNPLLGSLQDNAGPTLTHALLRVPFLSPAVDAADNTNCPATDQRGQVRPVDADLVDPEAVCDIGAFELADANLVLRKTDAPDPVLPGQDVTYAVGVGNAGYATARDLVLTETMPPGLAFTIEAPDWQCTVPDPVSEPNVVRCDLPDLAWGSNPTVGEFSVPIPPDLMVGSHQTVTISNTATLVSGMLLDDPVDNSDTTQTTIEQGQADLKVTKTTEPQGTIWGGHPFTYTILITNQGPSVAENVQFSEHLTSAGPAFGSIISAPAYICNPAIGDPVSGTELQWDCTRNDLMYPYEQDEITVVVYVEGGGAVRNSVEVSADTEDPIPTNNLATSALAVLEEADLDVVKFSDPEETGSAYVPFTYTVQLSNHGPSGARNVLISDTLLSDFTTTASIVGAPGYTCDPGVGVPLSGKQLQWTCTRDAYMYFDVQDEITIVATGEGSGEVTNLVEVTTDSSDPEPSNNHAEDSISLINLADLQVVKMSKPDDAVLAGEQFSWYILVQNNGPSPARNVRLTDTMLSDGQFSVIDFTPGPEYDCTLTPSSGGHQLDCSRAEALPPGVQDEIIIQALSDETCDINNQVWVTTATPDPNTSNNQSLDSISVFEEADLQVTKMSKPDDAVLAGEQFSWYIFVQNNGPSPARDVRLTDTMLSDGQFFIFGPTLGPEYNCTSIVVSGGYQLNCSRSAPLPPGVQDQIIIEALSNETSDINNQVSVTTASPDPDASSNYAEDSIHVGDAADLALTKTAVGEVQVPGQQGADFDLALPGVPFPESPNYAASATEVTAGRRIQYTLTVDNTGPSTAQNVVVTDRLPSGVTLYPGSLSMSQGSCETGTPGVPLDEMVCGLGKLDRGQSATISFQVLVGRALPEQTVLENDALVYSEVYDGNNGNNRDTAIIRADSYADLSIVSRSVGEVVFDNVAGVQGIFYLELHDQVTAGRQIRYEVTVQNKGPSDAREVVVDDLSWIFLFFTFVQADGASCHPDIDNPDGRPGHLLCELGTIPAGTAKSITIYMLVDPQAPDYVSPYVHESKVSASTQDPFPDDNFVEEDITVNNKADLSIRKTSEPWMVYAGEQIKYDISLVNNGPSFARTVSVVDTLPEGVDFEMSTEPANCVENGSLVCTWGFGEGLMPGDAIEFSFYGRVAPDTLPGTINNRARVETDIENLLFYNDSDTAANSVKGKADLKIQKFGKPEGLVAAGEELTYTVIVDNLGTGYAHDVLLTDVLESSGTFDLISVTSNRDADCTPPPGTFDKELQLTCSLTNPLEVATTQPGSGRWMLTVIVRAAEAQDINNVAKVASSDYDPDLSNNEATAEHEITAVADLEIIKSAWGEVPVGCGGMLDLRENEVAAGGTLTYTLNVTNHGPSTAQNVVVRDQPLPSILEIEEVTPSQGACDEGHMGAPDYLLICNLGTLLPDQSETVAIVARVPSSLPDGTPLLNVARAYSDMFDDNNGNDVVTNHTIVSRLADLMVEKTQEPETGLPTLDITYTITITNLGPSNVDGIFVSDTLPVQLLDATWTCCASDGECDAPCETPTCPEEPCPWPDPDTGVFAQANIPVGERVIYTVEGVLDIWPCGVPFTNTVEITAPQSLVHPEMSIDPCPDNNTAEAVNEPPQCNYIPLALKTYSSPDSPL